MAGEGDFSGENARKLGKFKAASEFYILPFINLTVGLFLFRCAFKWVSNANSQLLTGQSGDQMSCPGLELQRREQKEEECAVKFK